MQRGGDQKVAPWMPRRLITPPPLLFVFACHVERVKTPRLETAVVNTYIQPVFNKSGPVKVTLMISSVLLVRRAALLTNGLFQTLLTDSLNLRALS